MSFKELLRKMEFLPNEWIELLIGFHLLCLTCGWLACNRTRRLISVVKQFSVGNIFRNLCGWVSVIYKSRPALLWQ